MNGMATLALTGGLPMSLVLASACHRAPVTTDPMPEADAVFMLGIAATPDSAVRLAKFALGIVDGVDELPHTRKEGIVVARRYAHARKGGGQTDVAVIVIVQHRTPETADTTRIQLSAWALDTRADLPIPQRRVSPAAATFQRPPVAMRPNQPRRVTAADSTDWGMLQLVLDEFRRLGARQLP
jgi:hypothetical protein